MIYKWLVFHIYAGFQEGISKYVFFWRKLRSQTSDKYGQMEKQSWEQSAKKKSQKRERSTVKSNETLFFFQCSVAPEGRKVGLLKRRVQSHLGKCEIKNCSPLWRDTHLEVKTQNCEKRPMFGTLFKLMSKRCARLRCEAHFDVTTYKPNILGELLEVEMLKKCKARSTFRCQNAQNHVWCTFGSWDVEKVHTAVARRTWWRQNHHMFGPLLQVQMLKKAVVARSTFRSQNATAEVEMLKKCTRLWRKAHFQVKTRYNYYNDDSCMQLQLR